MCVEKQILVTHSICLYDKFESYFCLSLSTCIWDANPYYDFLYSCIIGLKLLYCHCRLCMRGSENQTICRNTSVPSSSTYMSLQIVYARFGKPAHIVFLPYLPVCHYRLCMRGLGSLPI